MDFYIFSFLFSICTLQFLPVHCQTDVSSAVWIVPDGSTADLSRTYTEGITLQVTWNPIPDGFQFQNLCDLWVTTWDYEVTAFSQRLTGNINTNNSGTYDWTIKIPAKVLNKDAKYVLRFKETSSEYDSGTPEISSTGFLIIIGGSSSSSTTTSTQVTSMYSSTSPTSTTPTSFATSITVIATTSAESTPVPESGNKGLSGGATAGIAVGAVAVALLIAGLVYFVFRLRRHAHTSSQGAPKYPSTDPPTYYDEPPKQPSTQDPGEVVEIGGRERVELAGS